MTYDFTRTGPQIQAIHDTVDNIYNTLGNSNLLSNHNFLIASPDNITHPSATPTDYLAGTQIFSNVFVSTDIVGLTLINGRLDWVSGSFYMPVSNSGGLEYVTELTASVADFDGRPRARGVSFALVGDEYRVTVGVDALEDASGNSTPLGSVKLEQGSVATRHEIVDNPKEQAYAGDSQILGGGIYPESSIENIETSGANSNAPLGTEFVRVNGNLYRLSIPSSGAITAIDEQNLSVVIGGVTSILLPNKFSKSSTVVFSEMTDNAEHLQGVLDWNVGGKVVLGFEGSYILTNGEITIPKGSRLDLNGSTFTFNQNGSQRGFIQSDSTDLFSGIIRVVGTPSGGGGDSGSCVSAGNQGTGVGAKRARSYNIDVDTIKPDGNGIVYFGSCRNCTVKDVSFPDSSTMARVVSFEWGGPSTANNNGHPHNNTIKRIMGGEISGGYGNSYVVWLSSVFNTEVSNIYSSMCSGLVGIFTGDESNAFADTSYKNLIGSGITINNASGKTDLYGIRVYGKGMSQQDPLFERPIINNLNVEGTGTSDSEFGVSCGFTGGVVVNNPNLRKLGYGFITEEGAQHIKINDGAIYENRKNAVRFGNVGGVSDCFIEGTRMYKNNQANDTGVSSAAALAIAFADQCGAKNCKFGLAFGEIETQQYSIFIESGNSKNCDISDNHTYSILSGGVAYVNGASSDYDMNTTGQNNTAESGISLFGGAPTYSIDSLGRRSFIFSGSSGFPVSGSWVQGDNFQYSSPLPGGSNYFGAVFTSATGWENYGLIT